MTTPQKKEMRMDPSLVLHDDLMAHIFSFVGGGRGRRHKANIAPTVLQRPEGSVRLLSLHEAGRLQFASIAKVSQRWQAICQANMSLILGPLHGTFNTFSSHKAILDCMNWMIKYKLRIGSIYLYEESFNISALIKLLQECDTTDLQKIAVNLEGFELGTRPLQDIIAQECPNLKELFTDISAANLRRDNPFNGALSRKLFSMPSIRYLHLKLVYNGGLVGQNGGLGDSDGWAARLPISDLKGLQELRLSSSGDFISSRYRRRGAQHTGPNIPASQSRRWLVHSESLQTLDVCDLNEWNFVKCDCPNLKKFSCKRWNGTVPDSAAVVFDRVTNDGTSITTAGCGPTRFVGLNVPPTCVVSISHYKEFDRGQRQGLKRVLLEGN